MRYIHFLFLFSILFLISFSTVSSFGDHGSGGGSGCSGDCTPPTMGIGENNSQNIYGGLTINGNSFTVDYYEQEIPTQISKIGETTEISIKIFENSGVFYLSNVQLMLGEKEEFLGGQLVDVHPVQIIWEKTINGNESFFVIDENEFLSNVDVESFVDGDHVNENIITLTFRFVPVTPFDANPIRVIMWDHNLSSWTNYFYNALEISSDNSTIDNLGTVVSSIPKELMIPSWIKNNAGFWADDLIDDSTFVLGIQYCIENNILHIPNLPKYSAENILHFVDLSKGPQHYLDRYYDEPSYKEWFDTNFPDYTIEQAVGLDSSYEIPTWIKNNVGWWSNGQIDDVSFVSGIEYLIKNGILVV